MTRIRRLSPVDLDPPQRLVYDEIAGGPRGANKAFRLVDDDGGLEGPFNAMLLHPPIGNALQQLGAAVRYHGSLSGRAREIAILLVAARRSSAFERYAHEAVGASEGLSQAEIVALRDGLPPVLADPVETAVAAAVVAIIVNGTLTENEYVEAARWIAPAGLFELTTLVGYYDLLALQLRIFDADHVPSANCCSETANFEGE